MIPQQASITTRVKVWFETLPLLTRSVLVLCVGIYILGLLTGFDDHAAVCLNPHTLVERFQIHRLFTSAFFHAGILHIGFNMLAFLPIATSLERQLGTLQTLHLLLVLILLGDFFYILASYMATLVLADARSYLASCAIGLSGAIFGLIVVDNACSGAQTRSIFGMFTVPAKWYPWALLLFWQLLMPGVSFLGHLGGVLAGQAYVWGWLRWLMLSTSAYQVAEGWRGLDCCRRWDCYIVHTGAGGYPPGMQLPTSYNASVQPDSGLAGALRRPAAWLQSTWPSPTRGSTGGSSPEAGRKPARQPGSSSGQPGSGPFKGRSHTLGGATTVPPASAAAAAAAARMAKDGGFKNGGNGAGNKADAKSKQPEQPADSARAGAVEAGLQQLASMGYEEAVATAALSASGGDVPAAVNMLCK